MEQIKQSMIDEAIEKYSKIYICDGKTLEKSFTQEGDLLIFWFNINTGSTKVVTRNIKGV